jgi:DNA-binding ferritin-like protein
MEMIRNLLDSNNQIIRDLNDGFAMANAANGQGLANFIAERIDQHQFWSWQLSSSLKTSVN